MKCHPPPVARRLMYCPAHFNVGEESYHEKIGNERRAAITQEGKGNACDGKQADGHTDIENDVKRDGTDKPQSKEKAKPVPGAKSDI